MFEKNKAKTSEKNKAKTIADLQPSSSKRVKFNELNSIEYSSLNREYSDLADDEVNLELEPMNKKRNKYFKAGID